MKMAHVGVRTRRTQAAMAMSAAETSPTRSSKRRKINNSNNNNNNNTSQDLIKFSPSSFTDQFKSISSGAPEAESTTTEERCSSPASSPASCCSSNGSFGLHEERMIKFLDLEVDSAQVETSTCNCGDEIRREVSLSSELRMNSQEVESMEKPTTRANSRYVVSMPKKMPTALELEEFFAAAEKDIQKLFSDKYNYDIVKDMPLEGRYEWVQLKP